jgi:NDP-sugar pyrophosphorylase family protein
VQAADLFTLPESLAFFRPHFSPEAPPWEWVRSIARALASWDFAAEASRADRPPGVHVVGPVHLDPSVTLPAYCTIEGPVWIGPETVIRPGALIRGNVIVGARSILGNACEYKNCLLLDRVQTPHYNYVGDSVLGSGAHLAAGVICSNLRLDQKTVIVRGPDGDWDTGLRKFGAAVGENAEVGCNAVLNPGTVLGRRSLVAPAIAFGGYLPPATLARVRASLTLVPRKD